MGRQASRPLLIGLKVGRMLKRTSGLNKLMSIVHRMGMEFESKFLVLYPLTGSTSFSSEEGVLAMCTLLLV